MEIPHEAYKTFLKTNGFVSFQEAINKLGGPTRFKEAVKNSIGKKPIEKEPKPKNEVVKITAPKEIIFSRGYFIFPDGRCYSEKTKRFLKKQKIKGKTDGRYYSHYDLRPYGKCLVSRLVMFFYAKHDYKTFKEMPRVMFIDGNPENCNINNLRFATQGEINVHYNIKPPISCYVDKGTIKEKDLDRVKAMLSIKMPYPDIAKVFETSPMAVYRFVKKNKLNS